MSEKMLPYMYLLFCSFRLRQGLSVPTKDLASLFSPIGRGRALGTRKPATKCWFTRFNKPGPCAVITEMKLKEKKGGHDLGVSSVVATALLPGTQSSTTADGGDERLSGLALLNVDRLDLLSIITDRLSCRFL